jgi:signal transduction histidine kinase
MARLVSTPCCFAGEAIAVLKVTIFREGRKQQEVATEKKNVVIGREAGCDIVLDDRTVSRRHAEIRVGEDAVLLTDLGSSNGTYVNRQRVENHTLAAGDAITIGSYGLKVRGHASLGGESSGAIEVEFPAVAAPGGVSEKTPSQTAIITTLDARRIGRGEDVREGEIDREAMMKRLSVFYDLGENLCGRLSAREIADTFFDVLFEVFPGIDRALMMLEDKQTRTLVPLAARQKGQETEDVRISRTVVETVLEEKQAVICGDTGTDSRFKASASLQDLRITSIMCVPLLVADRVLGMVEVDSRRGGIGFRDDDLRLLVGLTSQVGIALENSRLYTEIESSKRLAAIGQTVSGVAHCVKNVLNGMDGGLFIARKGLDAGNQEKIAKGWDMLERNSGFLKSLVLDMLDYSKDRPPEYVAASLDDLFGEIMAFVEGRAAEGGITLALDIAAGIGPVELDPTRMKRALLNIVANAVEATPEGGKVTISISPQDAEAYCVMISDTGKGIPEDMLVNIFEPFVSTKGSKGTGLGLPVMKKIVEEHGGRVDLESRVGEGTTFRVTLPRKRK